MAWFKKRPKESTRGNAIEAKEAQIKRRAAELQTLAGKGGVPTGEAVTALAAALGNEIAALVMLNPSLTVTVDEIADVVCQSVRDAARYTVNPSSSDAPKEVLTEPEFEQLTMRIIKTATPNATVTDAMAATAKALGVMIATAARQGGFDEVLRWGQNAVIDSAREARDRLARKEK